MVDANASEKRVILRPKYLHNRAQQPLPPVHSHYQMETARSEEKLLKSSLDVDSLVVSLLLMLLLLLLLLLLLMLFKSSSGIKTKWTILNSFS